MAVVTSLVQNSGNNLKSACHYFYENDYREYFTNIHTDKIGFYIYDGDHSYENQLMGLKVAEPFFSEGCLIMVDDTNTEEARQATMDFMATGQHKYDIIFNEKTLFNQHPTLWNGVMVLQRIG